VIGLLLFAACGGADAGGGGEDAGPIDVSDLAYSPCDPAEHVGTFRIDLAEKYTGISGTVALAVVPQDVPLLAAEDGNCRLWAPRELFCDPGCAPGETCGEDGCIPYPANLDVGTVTVDGLLVAVEMTPTPPAQNYTNPEPLPHPGFAAGSGIRLRASGSDVEAFTLLGWGISPLASDLAEVVADRGMPVSIAWNAPEDAGPARVRISLDVNRHGGAASRIECDADDTGSFEIPSALVDGLFDAGLSGFPRVVLRRRSMDRVEIAPGCVELDVGAPLDLDVSIPGLDSCTEDGDCTAPETCQPDLTCG
jgi:hypothetical protein